MKGIIWLLFIGLIVISGCGNNQISKEEAMRIVDRWLIPAEQSWGTDFQVISAKSVDNYWVVQVLADDASFVWVDKKTGFVECANNNANQPTDCIGY